MIEGDPRDNGAQRLADHIGAVQKTAHTDLADNDVTALSLEDPKAERGDEFELGDDHALLVQLIHQRLEKAHRSGKLLFGDHFVIDLDALAEIDDIGRDKQPDLVARLLQNKGEHRRDRALAVGTGNVDELLVERFRHLLKQLLYAVKPRTRAEPIE